LSALLPRPESLQAAHLFNGMMVVCNGGFRQFAKWTMTVPADGIPSFLRNEKPHGKSQHNVCQLLMGGLSLKIDKLISSICILIMQKMLFI